MSIRFFIFWVLCGRLRPDAYTEEEAKKASSTGSSTLARDQKWPKDWRHSDVELDLDNSEPTSFPRPTTPVASSYCLQNDSSYGSTGMEMWCLPHHESQKSRILPDLRRSLAHVLRGGQLLELVSEQCNAILPTAKKWKCEETVSKAVSQRDIQRQGERRQRQQGERQASSVSRRQSGFSLLGGGRVIATAAIHSSLAGHGLLAISDGYIDKHYSCEPRTDQPTCQAIKKAFPEASAMPAPVKEALEKAEVSGAKQITKDLHAATSALGRARRAFQEASEARKQLKSGWMKHLEESLAAWEKQLDTYRTSYAQLQDAESKALQDVANAKRSIQQLNSQSGSSGAEDQALVEEAVDLNGDKEEEKANQRLQAVMQSCMVSVGVEMRQPEIMEIHSDTDVAPSKRQRSADPTLPKPTTSSFLARLHLVKRKMASPRPISTGLRMLRPTVIAPWLTVQQACPNPQF